MQAPTEAREKYFEEVYGFNIFKTTNPLLGGGSLAREQSTRKQEAEQKMNVRVGDRQYFTGKEAVSDGIDTACDANIISPSQGQVSHWVQLKKRNNHCY